VFGAGWIEVVEDMKPDEILESFELFCKKAKGRIEKVSNTVYCVLPEEANCYIEYSDKKLKIETTEMEEFREKVTSEFELELPDWSDVVIEEFAPKKGESGWLFGVEVAGDQVSTIQSKNLRKRVKTIAISSGYGEYGMVKLSLRLYG